jgi:putative glutamine amidotransferase
MAAKKYVLEITPQSCYNHLQQWGELTTNYKILWSEEAHQVALIVFTGGTDVNPSLYGEKHFRTTDRSNTVRDEHEVNCFTRARELGIPMIGICRGSQFLCVMAGGKLVQDVTGHVGYHGMKTHDNKVIQCNSTHHQMQRPPEGAKILAMAEPRRSKHYMNGEGKNIAEEMPGDVEVVYYPNINALSVQYHPEWLEDDHECVSYYKQVIEEFLIFKKN